MAEMTWVDLHFGAVLIIALVLSVAGGVALVDLRPLRMSPRWFRSQGRSSEVWE